METPCPPLSPPGRTLCSLPPTPPPLALPIAPMPSPHPPFRARAESAWGNLAADSAGAGASLRLGLRVLARPSAPPLPPTPTESCQLQLRLSVQIPSPALKPRIVLVSNYLSVTPHPHQERLGRTGRGQGREAAGPDPKPGLGSVEWGGGRVSSLGFEPKWRTLVRVTQEGPSIPEAAWNPHCQVSS